eukprot:1194069-Prorocentrum_minimum.AAC.1
MMVSDYYEPTKACSLFFNPYFCSLHVVVTDNDRIVGNDRKPWWQFIGCPLNPNRRKKPNYLRVPLTLAWQGSLVQKFTHTLLRWSLRSPYRAVRVESARLAAIPVFCSAWRPRHSHCRARGSAW